MGGAPGTLPRPRDSQFLVICLYLFMDFTEFWSKLDLTLGIKILPKSFENRFGRPSTSKMQASKTPKVVFWAKTSHFGAPGGQEEVQYQVKVCGNHESNPGTAAQVSWDQKWPLRTLRGPPGPPTPPPGSGRETCRYSTMDLMRLPGAPQPPPVAEIT